MGGEMIYILGVPTLCRYDLLTACLDSAFAGSAPPHLAYVVNNGEEDYSHPDGRVRVIRTPFNLGVARSWNLLWNLAAPHPLLLTNDDIVFGPDAAASALGTGAGLTCLHGWACFLQRREVWDGIGPYDANFWPAYYEDNDYAYRMKLAGGAEAHPLPGLVRHAGSATLAGLPAHHAAAVRHHAGANRDYYVRKWGGIPGSESYRIPFNGGVP